MAMKNITFVFKDEIVNAIRDKSVDLDRRINLWATMMCAANKAYNEAVKLPFRKNIGGKYDYSIGFVLLCELESECDCEVPGLGLLNAIDCWISGSNEAEAVDSMCADFFAELGLFEVTRIFEYNKEETNNGR